MKKFWETPLFFGIVFALSACLFATRAVSFVSVKMDLSRKRASVQALEKSNGVDGLTALAADGALQGLLGDDAKASGVKRLLSIGGSAGRDQDLITMEWEADTKSTVKFLTQIQQKARLGRCERLHVSAAEGSSLRVVGTFDRRPSRRPASGKETAPVVVARNVFFPLWEPKKDDVVAMQAMEIKKQEEARQQEQARVDKESKEREEADKIQAKKMQLEADLMLTGIVNNGREALAFINTRAGGGQTMMVQKGDVVQEARVVLIDEKKGEIQLDYLGKFQVNLKMNSRSGGNTTW